MSSFQTITGNDDTAVNYVCIYFHATQINANVSLLASFAWFYVAHVHHCIVGIFLGHVEGADDLSLKTELPLQGASSACSRPCRVTRGAHTREEHGQGSATWFVKHL